MVTMFHGEIWNTLKIRYLYDQISMRKILELNILKKCIEDEHIAKPYEAWSPINRGTPSPLAPYHGIRGLKQKMARLPFSVPVSWQDNHIKSAIVLCCTKLWCIRGLKQEMTSLIDCSSSAPTRSDKNFNYKAVEGAQANFNKHKQNNFSLKIDHDTSKYEQY